MHAPHTDGFFFDALWDHASGAFVWTRARPVPSSRRFSVVSRRPTARAFSPHRVVAFAPSRRGGERSRARFVASRRVAFVGLVRWVETETSRFGRRGTTDGADGSRDVDVVGLARACVEDDDDGDVDGWEGEDARVRDRGASRATGVRRARGKGGRGGFLSARARLEARGTRGRVEETGGGGE